MDKKVLIAEFKKARESINRNRTETVLEINNAYIAMGHYDVVLFRQASRGGGLVLNASERFFLPLEEARVADAVGDSTYRFLLMISILNNAFSDNIKEIAQKFKSHLNEFVSVGIKYTLYRSIDNCDIVCIIDSDNYPEMLDLVRSCADSMDDPNIYFFTIPMLNAKVLKDTKSIESILHVEVPKTALLVRTTVREHQRISELLSAEMLLKGLVEPSKSIMFGASDIVIDLGQYSPYKVITYYRNVNRCIADYLKVLYSAEVEIMKRLD